MRFFVRLRRRRSVRIFVKWFWTRRREESAVRKLVRDREQLAALSPGGSSERPIPVTSPAVIEPRVLNMTCPLCEGYIRVVDHHAPKSGLRRVRVRCEQCSIRRDLWFRLVSNAAN
jgi:predicted Zn finger-like uncharacterized protein